MNKKYANYTIYGLFACFVSIPVASFATPIRCNRPQQGGVRLAHPSFQGADFIGVTAEEVNQRFNLIQEMNFQHGDSNAIISRLSDRELGDIAASYRKFSSNGSNRILRIFAQKLNSNSLDRVAEAFGIVETEAAVRTYAPPSVSLEFLAVRTKRSTSLPRSVSQAAAAPNIDMTLQEIYLDFRTAPIGSLSPASSLVMTTVYAGGWLVGTWATGYEFGSGIHSLIEQYDPEFDEILGGTIDQAVQNIDAATDEFEQGNVERGVDDLFGGPLADGGNYSGDFDVGESYDYYESEGGDDC